MKSKITKNMTIGEIVAKHPETTGIFMRYGLHCIGCCAAGGEALGQGAAAHGINGKKLSAMLKELNK